MPSDASLLFLGIDTGGTFTDFVLLDGERLHVHKVLSTPEAPERAVLQGIRDLGLSDQLHRLHLVHGSTVATNAALEGKGVRTALVTDRGFADLLTLGRQTRAELYHLTPAPPAVAVPAELCLEVEGRRGADGSEVVPLDDACLLQLRERIEALAPEAVAINLLFSYVDSSTEERVARAMPNHVFVSRSSEVLPEQREYERGVATWLNAWLGPLMQGYLRRLVAALPNARVAVMQSSGDTMDAARAGRSAVRLLLSGPAGGLAGAAFVADQAGCDRLLTFDMGGTSTDVALLDGRPHLTSEGRIGPWPVAVPMLDIHTIGAGGGSIAAVDAGGMLHVGPESAGAAPGPACYGRGGVRATVTDAHVVLGRLRPDAFLGGRMELDTAAARRAVSAVAAALGTTIEEAALGIVRVANEHMARALRVVSVQRGVDARALTLVCFGGAGGLHVCELAEALGMARALVPVHGGVLSALGMLAASRGRHLSRACAGVLDDVGEASVTEALRSLAAAARAELAGEGVDVRDAEAAFSLDLRYRGQAYTLNVQWLGAGASAEAFHTAHLAQFGHRHDLPIELVNVRVAMRVPGARMALPSLRFGEPALPRAQAAIYGGAVLPADVYRREELSQGQRVMGPALIVEAVASTYVASGWSLTVDETGNLLLQRT